MHLAKGPSLCDANHIITTWLINNTDVHRSNQYVLNLSPWFWRLFLPMPICPDSCGKWLFIQAAVINNNSLTKSNDVLLGQWLFAETVLTIYCLFTQFLLIIVHLILTRNCLLWQLWPIFFLLTELRQFWHMAVCLDSFDTRLLIQTILTHDCLLRNSDSWLFVRTVLINNWFTKIWTQLFKVSLT